MFLCHCQQAMANLCVIAILLPQIFYFERGAKNKAIVVVVSLLTALMKDQVSSITEMGLSAAVKSEKESASSTVKTGIKNGKFQIVCTSPESLFNAEIIYLVGFVVDEAHCIKKW